MNRLRLAVAAATLVAVVVGAVGVILMDRSGDEYPSAEGWPILDCEPVPLRRILPGTPIGDRPPPGWTRLVMKCRSRLASGAVDELHRLAAPLSELLFTTMVAKVVAAPVGTGGAYRLGDVAVGLGTRVGEEDRIISSQTREALGVDFGFWERQLLAQGEKKLDRVIRVARTETTMIVDSPSILNDAGRHRDVVHRYAFLVQPQTGELVSLVWQINLDDDERYAGVDGPIVRLEPNLVVSARVHVDGGQVFLGIPTARAFGVEGLPPGSRRDLPDDVRRLAGLRRFTPDSLRRLDAALRRLVGFPPG